MKGDPKKPVIISWSVGPLWYRLLPLGQCSRIPSISVYKLALLWEAAFGFSEFFWKLLQRDSPFHDGWPRSAPAHTAECSAAFDRKWQDSMPHPPYSPNLASRDFFCFPRIKIKGKHFANVEDLKQKIGEALKGIKMDKFKNCCEQWKNCLDRCVFIKWRVLWGWLKFKHVRITTQFLINKFHFWVPPHIMNV